jgi:zona occludens toxin (predicted ATPase)
LFAITKLLFLFVILFAGLIFSATKKFRPSATSMFADHDCSINATAVDSNDNFYSSFNPLGGVRSTGVDVATAYLQIIFTFGGFNQANYVSSLRLPYSLG